MSEAAELALIDVDAIDDMDAADDALAEIDGRVVTAKEALEAVSLELAACEIEVGERQDEIRTLLEQRRRVTQTKRRLWRQFENEGVQR